MPVNMPLRAKTRSLLPEWPNESRASTSQASTAPVWQVKPKPSITEARMKPVSPQWKTDEPTYPRVATAKDAMPIKNDARRPIVSAMTPVGTSNTIWPALKVALTSMTKKMFKPASSRKSVLTPQISEADRTKSELRE